MGKLKNTDIFFELEPTCRTKLGAFLAPFPSMIFLPKARPVVDVFPLPIGQVGIYYFCF